jgi:hypothetical protein
MSLREQILSHIQGLSELTDEHLAEVEAVCKSEESLFISPIDGISDLVAVALSEHRGRYLSLGVSSLSNEAARALGEYNGTLVLDRLPFLSVEVARALCGVGGTVDQRKQPRGRSLSLNGLQEISPEVALALAEYDGTISLRGLTSLSEEVACVFTQNGGALLRSYMEALEGMGDEHFGVASAAAKTFQNINLDHLNFISPKAASAFARFEGVLSLDGLKSISNNTVRAFCAGDGTVERRKKRDWGKLSLNGLEVFSDEVACIFKEHGNWRLNLDGVTSLSNKAAIHILKGGFLDGCSMFRNLPCDRDRLEQAEELNDDDLVNTCAVAARSSNLELPRLRKISDLSAKALALVDGAESEFDGIHLTGMRELSDKAFCTLAKNSCFLNLKSLESISSVQLEALHAWRTLNPEHSHGTDLGTLWRKLGARIRERGCISDTEEDLNLLDTASFIPDELSIPHLEGISDGAANILFFYPESLFLDGLKQLPDLTQMVEEGGGLLSKRLPDGRILSLNGLREISESNLVELLKPKGGLLVLDGLKVLPESEATLFALSNYKGKLSLNGLETLSLALADALSKIRYQQGYSFCENPFWWLEYSISLKGVRQFEEGASDALAKHRGTILLGGSSAEICVPKIRPESGELRVRN